MKIKLTRKKKISSLLKIFIAGSKVLADQRNILRAVLMRQQGLFDVVIETKTFEDFSDSLIKGGQQAQYNKYIATEADVVVFIFDGRVGDITKHEFDVAYNTYSRQGQPLIFVYCRKEDPHAINPKIAALKNELNALHQYYTEYADNQELERLFEKSIVEYLVKTHFLPNNRTPEERIAFDLACQELSNTLIACLAVVDELGCVIRELSVCWNKYLKDSREAISPQRELTARQYLLQGLNHYLEETQRISKIYPPQNISISPRNVEILAPQVKGITEISMLPTMYSSYFDDAMSPFLSIQDYLGDSTVSSLKKRMIHLHLDGFQYLANGFFYTCLEYLSQLPEPYQKNLKEMQLLWKTYPKGVSINASIEDYERFAKREFDEYEKIIIELNAVLEAHDDEIEQLKMQIDKVQKSQQQQLKNYCQYCGSKITGSEKYCPNCGQKL